MSWAAEEESLAVEQAEIDKERRRYMLAWLQMAVDDEEAAAMVSRGYRYLPCRGCGRLSCDYCSRDPAEQVRASGRRSSSDPRFVTALVNRLSRFPSTVVARGSATFKELATPERLVLLLSAAGLSDMQIGRKLKLSRSTIFKLRRDGLQRWAGLIWPPLEAVK